MVSGTLHSLSEGPIIQKAHFLWHPAPEICAANVLTRHLGCAIHGEVSTATHSW